MDKEQAITLVKYHIWASHKVLVKAAHLTQAQLLAITSLSHHSIMETLIHILDTQWYWRKGAQTGKLPTRPLTTSEFPNPSSLRRLWARPCTRPLWHILQHIVNHGTHHCSELGNSLAALGQSPKDKVRGRGCKPVNHDVSDVSYMSAICVEKFRFLRKPRP